MALFPLREIRLLAAHFSPLTVVSKAVTQLFERAEEQHRHTPLVATDAGGDLG
jgi:hypothetical protein